MTKIRLTALWPDGTAAAPMADGGRVRRRWQAVLARAWQRLQTAAGARHDSTRHTVTIDGYYGHQAVSMRLQRDDVRHYARLALQHGLQPSLAGYLDFRVRTADFPLPSPLERAMADLAQDESGPRADRFLFDDPARAERDFLGLLEP